MGSSPTQLLGEVQYEVRILAVDPLRCPRCDGRLRPIAEITEPDVIARILEHLADQTPRAPPREPMSAADPPLRSLH